MLPVACAAELPPAEAEFLGQIRENFAAWDADRNLSLSPAELAVRIADPAVKAKAAAALVAVHRFSRDPNYELPPASLATLERSLAERRVRKLGAPDYAGAYVAARRKLEATTDSLYGAGEPSLADVKQERLSDCILLAPLAAAMHRDERLVRRIITPLPGGRFAVTFPNGKRIEIDAPTDAEVALTTSAPSQGKWLNVIEKAYGALRRADAPPERQSGAFVDVLAAPGSIGESFQLFTSKRTGLLWLNRNGPPNAAAPAAMVDVEKLRRALALAFKEKRLVCAGTANERFVPGMNPRHAFAVLGFENDQLLIWDPHGRDFKPNGPPGVEYGYPTVKGRFRVPLPEFTRAFGSVIVERDGDAPTAKPKAGR
ncbi:MAG TPA: hypothetical protein VNC50_20485 [Planctomycetia bacterium]|nr:hypothetical protein [Planctomycetia bacterium]